MTNIVTLGLGSTPSGVILLGYHWAATPPAQTPNYDAEAARVYLRSKQRSKAEKAKRLAELNDAIKEAEEATAEGAEVSEAIAPVREIIERETGVILLPSLLDLEDALNQLAMIDQQIGAINQKRMDDAVAVLLLTE
jgi:hypothetical protein